MMPDIIQQIRDTYAENPAAALKLLPELFQMYDDGLIPVLPYKPHTFVWFIGEDGEIHSNYKLLGAISQYGKIVYLIYHGEACGEYLLVNKFYLSKEAAEAALQERET